MPIILNQASKYIVNRINLNLKEAHKNYLCAEVCGGLEALISARWSDNVMTRGESFYGDHFVVPINTDMYSTANCASHSSIMMKTQNVDPICILKNRNFLPTVPPNEEDVDSKMLVSTSEGLAGMDLICKEEGITSSVGRELIQIFQRMLTALGKTYTLFIVYDVKKLENH